MEIVQERVTSGNRALVDERRPIGPVRALLEEAMPVLWWTLEQKYITDGAQDTYNTSRLQHCVIRHLVDNIQLETISL